ncbi:MAG: amino acid ABC transporter permease, partial [Boseongicola sp.]
MSDNSTNQVSFVRHEQIAPSPPPMSESGIIKWVRENLFSSWFNAILTILAAYFVYRLVVNAAPWFYNGVWDAGSIKECRDILSAAGKSTGACFAVLIDRWDHMLFGFKYPADQYWRPTVAFVFLLLAIIPILFNQHMPRKLMILSALYPFLAYWLIWG